jgi:hypothetical protein
MIKASAMANQQNLRPFSRSDQTTEPLSASLTAVRLPVSIGEAISALGQNKTPWLRRVITEAAQRELLNQEQEVEL